MKKYIIIASAIIALVFSVWGFLSIKSTTVSKEINIFTALPQQPYSLLRINNAASISKALLYDNSYWQDVSKLASFLELNQLMVHFDSIKDTNPAVNALLNNRTFYMASFLQEDQTTQHLWFGQIAHDEWKQLEQIMLQHVNAGYYFGYENGIFLTGTNKNIVSQSILQIQSGQSLMDSDTGFNNIVKTAGKQAVFNWIFNLEILSDILLADLTEQGNSLFSAWQHYADWCCFDGIVEGDKLIFNGFASKKDQFHYTSLINEQESSQNTLTNRMPYNTYFYQHLALNNLDTYLQQLDAFAELHSEQGIKTDGTALETPTGESPMVFFSNFFGGEIASGWSPMGHFVIVKLIEPNQAAEKLQSMVEEMGYGASTTTQGGIKTYHFDSNGFAGCVFGSEYTLEEEHLTIVDNKLIIAPTAKFARYIASRKANSQTLQCAPNFQDANKTLLTKANLSMYINIPYMVRNASQFVSGECLDWINQTQSLWKNFSTCCIQSENDLSGKTFQHLFLQYNKVMEVDEQALLAKTESTPITETDKELENEQDIQLSGTEETSNEIDDTENTDTPTEEPTSTPSVMRNLSTQKAICTATLDYPAVIAPQLVKNHYTGENEIAIQDSHNQLYLISASGKILWKVPLQERIIGSILQVDLFKNSKLQMTFVTENEWVVIDRNGNMVTGFPKKLSQKAGGTLMVCDYDKSRNYRFFIPTQNGQLVLLKADGSMPSDWTFSGSQRGLISPLQYFNQKGKDFLVAFDNQQTYFLNRKGQERILPNNTIQKAQNGVFYQDALGTNHRFIATSPTGEILYVYNNEVKTASVKAYTNHHLFTLFKGNYGNYYIFFDQKGLDVFDRDLNIYMRDAAIVGGKHPTLLMHSSLMAAYEQAQKCWIIYNLVGKRSAYQIIASDTPLAYFGAFKPYQSPCLVVTEGKELKWYKINEK